MFWFIPVGNNIPKDFALRNLGERLQNELLDAMTACSLALQTPDLAQRLELINLVKLHITAVQSITKVFVEHVKKGVKFIGSVLKPGRTYLSNRTVGRMYGMLQGMECHCRRRNVAKVEQDVCSCNSYMGFLVHHATYGLRRRMFGRMRWFWKMAYISGKYTKVVLKKKFINKQIYGKEVFK